MTVQMRTLKPKEFIILIEEPPAESQAWDLNL